MATNFTASMNRIAAADKLAREIPEVVVNGILDDVEKTSVALQLGEVHRMAAYQERYRLTNSKPKAYWINATTAAGDKPGAGMTGTSAPDGSREAKDFGLKQTTSYGYENLTLIPDEIAVMVVMPDNWRDDSDLAWEEIRSHVRGAFAEAIDAAVLYGTSLTSHPLPATFGAGVVTQTIAKGKFYNAAVSANDRADDYAAVAQQLAVRGYTPDGYTVGVAEQWNLRRLRDTTLQPLLSPLTQGGDLGLYGLPLKAVDNGIWDATKAIAMVGDWSNLHIGIRKDMEIQLSNTGVITDAAGKVVYNPWGQDGEVLRACMRLGYLVTDPIKNLTGAREWPFEALVAASPAS